MWKVIEFYYFNGAMIENGLRIQKSHIRMRVIGLAYRICIIAVVLQCWRSGFAVKQLKNIYL